MTAYDVNDVRARFEAWWRSLNSFELTSDPNWPKGYAVSQVQCAWLAWQARGADLAGEVRELVEDWRTAADAHAEIGYPACADVGRRCADELEAALAKFHPTHQETK